jgi:hypothetical protein
MTKISGIMLQTLLETPRSNHRTLFLRALHANYAIPKPVTPIRSFRAQYLHIFCVVSQGSVFDDVSCSERNKNQRNRSLDFNGSSRWFTASANWEFVNLQFTLCALKGANDATVGAYCQGEHSTFKPLTLQGLMVTSVTKSRTQKLPYWRDHSLESTWGALSDGAISFVIQSFPGKKFIFWIFLKS